MARSRVNPEKVHGKVTVTAPSVMQIKEEKFHGGNAISRAMLIKTTHLFCIGVPENGMASLNWGRRRTIRERE